MRFDVTKRVAQALTEEGIKFEYDVDEDEYLDEADTEDIEDIDLEGLEDINLEEIDLEDLKELLGVDDDDLDDDDFDDDDDEFEDDDDFDDDGGVVERIVWAIENKNSLSAIFMLTVHEWNTSLMAVPALRVNDEDRPRILRLVNECNAEYNHIKVYYADEKLVVEHDFLGDDEYITGESVLNMMGMQMVALEEMVQKLEALHMA